MKSLIKEFLAALWMVLRLPALLLGEGLRRIVDLGVRKLVLLGVAAVILTLLASTTFFEITSQPGFCGSCHIMQPYIAAWANSSHRNVDCMKCHAQEGAKGYLETKFTAMSMLVNYATGVYKRSKPWAEIEDVKCLACHESRLLEGRIRFGTIDFDHTPHLTESRRGRTLRCTSCHSQIVQGEHISVTSSTCFLCHFKNVREEGRAELAACTKCHNHLPTGQEAVIRGKFNHQTVIDEKINCQTCHQQMWSGEGLVRRERCGTCHAQVDHINRINDLEFIHEWHITKRKIECQQCHDPIEHHQRPIEETISVSCNTCHEVQHAAMAAVYEGNGARLISQAMPDTMFVSGVVCMSCHKDSQSGRGLATIPSDACTPCHDDSYIRLADSWRIGFGAQIERLEKAIAQVGDHPRLADAKHDLALIKKGGPWHNPKYATAVIAQVSRVVEAAGGSAPIPAELPEASKACITCHIGVADVPVKVEWSAFDHRNHLLGRELACTQCHNATAPEAPGHGRLKPVVADCQDCHHNELAPVSQNCAPCHEPSRRLFTGDVPVQGGQPSPMAVSGMSCTDCHSQDAGFKPPPPSQCAECHGDEILDRLAAAQHQMTDAMKGRERSRDANVRLVNRDNGRAVHHPELAVKILTDAD